MKIKFSVPIFYTAVTVSDKIEDVFYTDHDRDLARKSFGQTGWFDGRETEIKRALLAEKSLRKTALKLRVSPWTLRNYMIQNDLRFGFY